MANEEDTVTQPIDPLAGKNLGTESSLSSWVGPYVTDMLGRGMALADQPYEAYTGPLTAGQSELQTQAFEGLAGLTIPTDAMGAFTPDTFSAESAQQYMNPYLQAALDPQIAEARRQAEITRLKDAGRLTRAGSYGGSRQAVIEAMGNRDLGQNLAAITGEGYRTAYDKALEQFNVEQDRGITAQEAANVYGLSALQKIADLGAEQRAIEAEGIAADKEAFEEQRDFPYKQVQYLQSLLQELPLEAQSYSYMQPSQLSTVLSGAGGLTELYDLLFKDK
jgi:hypothetical protein